MLVFKIAQLVVSNYGYYIIFIQRPLKKYNRVRQSLSIRNAFGDDRVRGGSVIFIDLLIDKQHVQMKMLVEAAKHTYRNNEHLMDLTLRGGVFE